MYLLVGKVNYYCCWKTESIRITFDVTLQSGMNTKGYKKSQRFIRITPSLA